MSDPLPADVDRAALRQATRHALWRQGDGRYLLHAGQLEVLDLLRGNAKRVVINVGRRWGKSRLMAWLCVLLVVLRIQWAGGRVPPEWVPKRLRAVVQRTARPARIVYAAPTQSMVREFVDPHFGLLASHLPAELRPEASANAWVWPDGSRVVLQGCEDRRKADRLRGPEADMAVVDEGGFIPIVDYVVRSVVGMQLLETQGPLLLPSTPPESPDHPWVALLEEARADGAYYHATTYDAPHVTKAMVSEILDLLGGDAESVEAKRELEARIVIDAKEQVIPEWSPELVEEHRRPDHFVPCVIGDGGFVDLTVILFGYYDFKSDLDVVERELVLHHTRSDLIDAEVARVESELWPGRRVKVRRIDAQPQQRADMSSPEWQSIRQANDEDAASAIADQDDVRHWLSVWKTDLHARVNAARVRAKRRRLRVHPSCTTTIAHAQYARWNRPRTDFRRPEAGGHHYDGCAALVYFLRDLDRSTNPYPRLAPGVTSDTHHVPAGIRETEKRRKIRRLIRS